MVEWLKDVFGVNKYAIVWDFMHCGSHLKGRHDGQMLGGMTKRFARRMANHMNRSYGTDGHWIEKEAP